MKLCECGCGNPAPISKQNRPERDQKKGEPVRFIRGHSSHPQTEETRRLIAEAGRGRRHEPESIEKQRRSKQGPLNPQWKGGRFQSKGYVWVRVGREHPMAMSNGYCLEHRLVEAAALGRMLLSNEHVSLYSLSRSTVGFIG